MPFPERAGLFPVLLLTGCAQPVVISGPPSSSVVDTMLSRSAADISAMQYRIHQSGPSAQRPANLSAAKPLTPQKPKAPAPLTPAINSASRTAPPSELGRGPAEGFIYKDGAAPTLRAALRDIVPPGQTVVFGKTVAADTPELWRWHGNDRWPYVVQKMLAPRGLKSTLNTTTKTLTVEPVARPQTSLIAGVSKPATSTSKTAPGSFLRGPVTPVTTAPLSGVNAQKAPTNSAITAPVAPLAPLLKTWKLEKGTSLKKGWMGWVDNEVCPVGANKKWAVQWETLTDYPIDYPLSFLAKNFEDATQQLFSLYRRAQTPLFVNGYRHQCLIVISEKP